MAIVPVGSTNLAAIGVPNVIVQIVPPNPLLNGVPTNIVGVVGIGTWGPVNSPVTVGSLQQLISSFGMPQNATYDLGTQVYNAYLQGATNFKCVRVTDGTDVPATSNVLDSTAAIALVLNAIYTGVVGNTLNATIGVGSNSTSSVPTYKFTAWLSGGVPEVFDNIGGSGAAFWTNLVNAINMGTSPQRGPSQLVQAGIPAVPASVSIQVAGSYTTLPTMSATIGSGATFTLHMFATSFLLGGSQSGYAVNDTVTFTGGTHSVAAVLTVTAVNGSGVITAAIISTAGNYTVLPSNPISTSTSGGGSGATVTAQWGILSAAVSGGTGYTSNSEVVITGGGGLGGGQATLTVTPTASTNAPAIPASPYTFANGTNGNSGVSDVNLIGSDVIVPRTGMYALRGTQASIGVIADQTNPSYWANQVAFGLSEGMYMIGTMANGYENNVAGAIAIKQSNNIASYAFKLMLGDWCQINDPFNNVVRFVSPQGFVAGVLAVQQPDNSSLNKIMSGIVATQKTIDQMMYTNADLQQLQTGGIDVITIPIPASNFSYGVRLGINTSGVATTIGDNYTRMINFLAQTFNTGLGAFIGLPQTVDVQNQARATLQAFLQNLQLLGLIGTLNGSAAFNVTLDSTNNPPTQVALGYMQANVQVTLWSIIFQFVVNLQAGQSVNVDVLPPQLI